MNGVERAFADYADALVRAGVWARWFFECYTFRIGDDCRYTPDFVVELPDGALEVHETKAAGKDGKPRIEEDARVKVRSLATSYPFRVFVRYRVGLEWRSDEIKP